MMEEWKEYKLGEICKSIADGDHMPPPKTDKGIPFVTISNIVGNRLDFTNTHFVPQTYYDGLDDKRRPHIGDTIYSVVGTFGKPVYVNEEKPFVFQRHIAILRPNESKIVPKFLFYTLLSPQFYRKADVMAIGAVQRTISLASLRNTTIKIPPIDIQSKIVPILSSLDDKIELNRRINENLEAQAQALFKSWFVDFEPFRDGEFMESGLGMIPKGWRVGSLSEFAEISKSSVNPQKQPQTAFVHYSIPSYDDGMKPEIQLGEEIKSNKFVIANKMTLFSKLNPRIKRVWYVDNLPPNSVCSTEFVPYKAKEEALSSFLHGLINSQGFYDFVMAMVNGATGSHQRFHPEDSLKYQIAYNEVYVNNYCRFTNPILNRILTNNIESRRLATLRDTLLPRLMSGEIKVGAVTL